jgi:hypothetical protein
MYGYKFGEVRKVEKAIKSQNFQEQGKVKVEKEKPKINMKMKFR